MKPKHSQCTACAVTTGLGAIVLALTSFAAQGETSKTNTKTGTNAGAGLTTGKNNTADGFSALKRTKTGKSNTAVGALSLARNVSGSNNAAFGFKALNFATADGNTAMGAFSLGKNTTGVNNVALGFQALYNNTAGNLNVALGDGALQNATGSQNIGIGQDGGFNLTTGHNNIAIGNDGVAGESGKIRIGTAGVHTDIFLAGVIRGDGSGLTGLSIPASKITGTINGGQLTTGSVTNAKLAPNLTLGGTTIGTFSGKLVGNATSATTATTAGSATKFTGALAGAITGPQGATVIAPGAVSSTKLASNLVLGGTTTLSGTVSIPNAATRLDFGSNARQMINLWGNGQYGIGIQADTLYQRSNNNFAWYRGGVHSNTSFAPGTGGTTLMTLDSNGDLAVNGAVYQGPNKQYQSTADQEGLRIVRGTVYYLAQYDVFTNEGAGYTVSRSNTGAYIVNFSNAFSRAPSVTANLTNMNGMVTAAPYADKVLVYTYNVNATATDAFFSFIAIGPR